MLERTRMSKPRLDVIACDWCNEGWAGLPTREPRAWACFFAPICATGVRESARFSSVALM